jgi:signal transduction histidine kinase
MEARPSLLIVDDEQGPAESLRMIFKPTYEVFMASGGHEALQIIHSAPIDVVTLDLRMPKMSGVEVMERIKQFDPDIEVIIITGYSSLESAISGLRHRVFDYVSKPFDVPTICGLVSRAVTRRRTALQSRRMKEDFLANVSHELRTPLSAIIGYSTLLAEELQAVVSDDQQTALERIQANSYDLLNLVDEVLLLNTLDAGETRLDLEPVDVRTAVNDVLEQVRPRAMEKGLLLQSEFAQEDLAIITDRDKFSRILHVLLDNACKFTPNGVITVVAQVVDEGLAIEVSDTGIGMEQEVIVRVLEGLSQGDASARRRFRGLGLGLRVATRLIDLLGGHLRVKSEADRGTQFVVTLPKRPASDCQQQLH